MLFSSIGTLPKEKEKEKEDGPGLAEQQASLRRYYVYKLLERLSAHNHRNFAILNSLDFVGPLFDAYHTSTSSSTPTPRSTRPPSPTSPQQLQSSSSTQPQLHPHSHPPSRSASLPPSSSNTSLRVLPKPERQVILKLLKRLLELGSTSEEARQMFQAALNARGEDTLNGDVLEVLRAGMKTRWPEHFSFVGPGALIVPCEPSKGLPSTGFTFMVSSDTYAGGLLSSRYVAASDLAVDRGFTGVQTTFTVHLPPRRQLGILAEAASRRHTGMRQHGKQRACYLRFDTSQTAVVTLCVSTPSSSRVQSYYT